MPAIGLCNLNVHKCCFSTHAETVSVIFLDRTDWKTAEEKQLNIYNANACPTSPASFKPRLPGDDLMLRPDSAQAVPRQVPAQISWPGPQIKTRLPFAHFHLQPTVQPSIPYASSPLPPLILFLLLLLPLPLSLSLMQGESGMQGQT